MNTDGSLNMVGVDETLEKLEADANQPPPLNPMTPPAVPPGPPPIRPRQSKAGTAGPPPLGPPPIQTNKKSPSSPIEQKGQGPKSAFCDRFGFSFDLASSSTGAGLEEKLSFFREKARTYEDVLQDVQAAWDTQFAKEKELHQTLSAEQEKNQELSEQVTSLDTSQNFFKTEIQKLEHFIESKKNEFEDYEKKVLQSFQQNKEQAKSREKELSDRLQKSTTGLQNQDKQIEILSSELDQERVGRQQDSAALSQEIVEREKELRKLRTELQESHDTWTNEHKTLLASLESKNLESKETLVKYDEIKYALTRQKEESEQLQSSNESLSHTVATLEKSLTDLQDKSRESLAAREQELQERTVELKEHLDQQRRDAQAQQEQQEQLETKFMQEQDSLQQRFRSERKSFEEAMKGQETQSSEKLKELKQKATKALEQRQDSIDELSALVAQTKQDLAGKIKSFQDLEGESARITDELSALQDNLEQQQQQIKKLEHKVEQREAKLKQFHGKLGEQRDSLRKHRERDAESVTNLQRLREERDNTHAQHARELSEREKTIAKLKTSVVEGRSDLAKLMASAKVQGTKLASVNEDRIVVGELMERTRKAISVAQKLLKSPDPVVHRK
jgi:chromosome segregation ATPase